MDANVNVNYDNMNRWQLSWALAKKESTGLGAIMGFIKNFCSVRSLSTDAMKAKLTTNSEVSKKPMDEAQPEASNFDNFDTSKTENANDASSISKNAEQEKIKTSEEPISKPETTLESTQPENANSDNFDASKIEITKENITELTNMLSDKSVAQDTKLGIIQNISSKIDNLDISLQKQFWDSLGEIYNNKNTPQNIKDAIGREVAHKFQRQTTQFNAASTGVSENTFNKIYTQFESQLKEPIIVMAQDFKALEVDYLLLPGTNINHLDRNRNGKTDPEFQKTAERNKKLALFLAKEGKLKIDEQGNITSSLEECIKAIKDEIIKTYKEITVQDEQGNNVKALYIEFSDMQAPRLYIESPNKNGTNELINQIKRGNDASQKTEAFNQLKDINSKIFENFENSTLQKDLNYDSNSEDTRSIDYSQFKGVFIGSNRFSNKLMKIASQINIQKDDVQSALKSYQKELNAQTTQQTNSSVPPPPPPPPGAVIPPGSGPLVKPTDDQLAAMIAKRKAKAAANDQPTGASSQPEANMSSPQNPPKTDENTPPPPPGANTSKANIPPPPPQAAKANLGKGKKQTNVGNTPKLEPKTDPNSLNMEELQKIMNARRKDIAGAKNKPKGSSNKQLTGPKDTFHSLLSTDDAKTNIKATVDNVMKEITGSNVTEYMFGVEDKRKDVIEDMQTLETFLNTLVAKVGEGKITKDDAVKIKNELQERFKCEEGKEENYEDDATDFSKEYFQDFDKNLAQTETARKEAQQAKKNEAKPTASSSPTPTQPKIPPQSSGAGAPPPPPPPPPPVGGGSVPPPPSSPSSKAKKAPPPEGGPTHLDLIKAGNFKLKHVDTNAPKSTPKNTEPIDANTNAGQLLKARFNEKKIDPEEWEALDDAWKEFETNIKDEDIHQEGWAKESIDNKDYEITVNQVTANAELDNDSNIKLAKNIIENYTPGDDDNTDLENDIVRKAIGFLRDKGYNVQITENSW